MTVIRPSVTQTNLAAGVTEDKTSSHFVDMDPESQVLHFEVKHTLELILGNLS